MMVVHQAFRLVAQELRPRVDGGSHRCGIDRVEHDTHFGELVELEVRGEPHAHLAALFNGINGPRQTE